ncbi:MAG: hypothetical protein IPN69_13605 [Acidobacteria bacterium]|nr:hypothetical protein [Acidobacteriota bacterium]
MNAGGYVKSRTDHQAFGEPIESGIGLRTGTQGFGAPQANRQGYGLTEKDSTGLNHTWFRKNENRAGRWTSPDPYNGSASVGNPQSWNRYSYVENQPTNFVDPSGLLRIWSCTRPFFELGEGNRIYGDWSCQLVYDDGAGWDTGRRGPWDGGAGAGGDGAESQNKPKQCAVAPLSPITNPDAQKYESGDRVNLGGLTSGTRDALRCLQNQIVPELASVAPGQPLETGSTDARGFTVNSGYRPQAYQDHLLEVWDKWQLLKNNKQPECQNLKTQLRKEIGKSGHDLAERPSAKISNHTRGTAFDISIAGVTASQIKVFAKRCSLEQGKGHGGGHHFNYLGVN